MRGGAAPWISRVGAVLWMSRGRAVLWILISLLSLTALAGNAAAQRAPHSSPISIGAHHETRLFQWAGQRAATGTGVVVDGKGHVLTAHHVVSACRLLSLRQGDAVVPARLSAADPRLDLALLGAEQPLAAEGIGFRSEPVVQGEAVVVAGFPREVVGRGLLKAQRGSVSSADDPSADSEMMRFNIAVNPGGSGGPVLDYSGRMIGLVTGMLYSGRSGAPLANPGVAVRAQAAEAFLRQAGVDVRFARTSASGIEDIAAKAAKQTVLVECLR